MQPLERSIATLCHTSGSRSENCEFSFFTFIFSFSEVHFSFQNLRVNCISTVLLMKRALSNALVKSHRHLPSKLLCKSLEAGDVDNFYNIICASVSVKHFNVYTHKADTDNFCNFSTSFPFTLKFPSLMLTKIDM